MDWKNLGLLESWHILSVHVLCLELNSNSTLESELDYQILNFMFEYAF